MYPLKTENTFLLREIFVFFSKVNLGYILRVNYTCLATTGSLKAMPRCPLPPHFIPEPPLPRCLVSSLFSPLPLFHFSTFSFRKHKTPPTREFLTSQKLCPQKLLRFATQSFRLLELPGLDGLGVEDINSGLDNSEDGDVVASLLGDLLAVVVAIGVVVVSSVGLADSHHHILALLVEGPLDGLGDGVLDAVTPTQGR